jgi:hypothetical protein
MRPTYEQLQQNLRMASQPPGGNRPYIPIVRAVFGKAIRGYFTGDRVEGFLVHWDKEMKKDCPCVGPTMACYFCEGGLNPRWKGFVAGAIFPQRARCLVEITAGAFRNSQTLKAYNGMLRGKRFELSRFDRPARNSPVKIGLVPDKPIENLEKAFDVATALLAVWGYRYSASQHIPADPEQERVDLYRKEF